MNAREQQPLNAWTVPSAIVALGCVSLAIRPVSYGSTIATVLVGAVAFLVPTRSSSRRRTIECLVVTAIGIATFWVGRELGNGIGIRLTSMGVLTIVVAALAEEAFFRRFMFAWIGHLRGSAWAFAVTTALFAVIHLPTYGPEVLWIDLAAGAVLGWQRWVTGTWLVPAATHVVANLLQMG